MVPPSSIKSICRSTSRSIASSMNLNELRFLVSVRVPKVELPVGRTETLTSKRILP